MTLDLFFFPTVFLLQAQFAVPIDAGGYTNATPLQVFPTSLEVLWSMPTSTRFPPPDVILPLSLKKMIINQVGWP